MSPRSVAPRGRRQPARRAGRRPAWLAAITVLAIGAILVTSTVWMAVSGPRREPPTTTPSPTIAPPTATAVAQQPTAAARAQATATPLETRVLPTASPPPSSTPPSIATASVAASPSSSSTPRPPEARTSGPTPAPSAAPLARATHTQPPLQATTRIVIIVEGLDDQGLACSSVALFDREGHVIQRLALSDAADPRRIVVQGPAAHWLRLEGGADGQCPWDNWNMDDADPNRVPIVGDEVTLRFVPIPDEPRPG